MIKFDADDGLPILLGTVAALAAMPSSVQTAAIALLVVAALATLLSYTSVVDVRSTAAADFGADLLVESRRRTSGLLEAQWNARKLAHTAQIVATSRDAVEASATGGATPPPVAAAAAAAAAPAPPPPPAFSEISRWNQHDGLANLAEHLSPRFEGF